MSVLPAPLKEPSGALITKEALGAACMGLHGRTMGSRHGSQGWQPVSPLHRTTCTLVEGVQECRLTSLARASLCAAVERGWRPCKETGLESQCRWLWALASLTSLGLQFCMWHMGLLVPTTPSLTCEHSNETRHAKHSALHLLAAW